jgi:hypothetical protein
MNTIMTVPAINGVMPHCESTRPNHECPYIKHGCTGCRTVPYDVKIKKNDMDITLFLTSMPQKKSK